MINHKYNIDGHWIPKTGSPERANYLCADSCCEASGFLSRRMSLIMMNIVHFGLLPEFIVQ